MLASSETVDHVFPRSRSSHAHRSLETEGVERLLNLVEQGHVMCEYILSLTECCTQKLLRRLVSIVFSHFLYHNLAHVNLRVQGRIPLHIRCAQLRWIAIWFLPRGINCGQCSRMHRLSPLPSGGEKERMLLGPSVLSAPRSRHMGSDVGMRLSRDRVLRALERCDTTSE